MMEDSDNRLNQAHLLMPKFKHFDLSDCKIGPNGIIELVDVLIYRAKDAGKPLFSMT